MRDRSGHLELIGDMPCIDRRLCQLDVRDGDVCGDVSIDIPDPFNRCSRVPDRNPQRPHDALERGPPRTLQRKRLTPEISIPGVRA